MLKTATFTAVALDPREPRQLLFVHLQKKLAGQLVIRGDEQATVTVRLEPCATVTGRMLDQNNQPVAGVPVRLVFHGSHSFQPLLWWKLPRGVEVKTDREGRFRAEGVTPGMKSRLIVSPDSVQELLLQPGETKDLGNLKVKLD